MSLDAGDPQPMFMMCHPQDPRGPSLPARSRKKKSTSRSRGLTESAATLEALHVSYTAQEVSLVLTKKKSQPL